MTTRFWSPSEAHFSKLWDAINPKHIRMPPIRIGSPLTRTKPEHPWLLSATATSCGLFYRHRTQKLTSPLLYISRHHHNNHLREFKREGADGKWAWIGLFAAELWFGFYWLCTQALRWNCVYKRTFKDRLSQRYENDLPRVDVFVCTADPIIEPPMMVINTVLSVMAYNYPPEKLSVYLSDDAGSDLTFYALLEASHFAKEWLPYCKKFEVEPRSPGAYFLSISDPIDVGEAKAFVAIKKLYENMESRIRRAANVGRLSEEQRSKHEGFSQWETYSSKQDHDTILQILIDGTDLNARDVEGCSLPTLVYLAREKRPRYSHNFKAGAINALIRVSKKISNGHIILNVDCDIISKMSLRMKYMVVFERIWRWNFMVYASCTYDENTLWGKEMGLKYGTLPYFRRPQAPVVLLTITYQEKEMGDGHGLDCLRLSCGLVFSGSALKPPDGIESTGAPSRTGSLKDLRVEPRSPDAYFLSISDPNDVNEAKEFKAIKKLYEDMENRITRAAKIDQLTEEQRSKHKGFSQWDSYSSIRDHDTILQILIDGRDPNARDIEGYSLPTLVYLAREKRPQHPHNFKAGAMNALIRVSGKISDGQIIHNVDCDISFRVGMEVEFHGLDEAKLKVLASCTYEENTQWGKETGLKYGCPVEDTCPCFRSIRVSGSYHLHM
ncbi:hypothetical protein Q3G72_033449 [Acer saccharum]|nr:hypothetical protein Q3G72_033449 [Acer saccharum]